MHRLAVVDSAKSEGNPRRYRPQEPRDTIRDARSGGSSGEALVQRQEQLADLGHATIVVELNSQAFVVVALRLIFITCQLNMKISKMANDYDELRLLSRGERFWPPASTQLNGPNDE
jgi:hypothetical protein